MLAVLRDGQADLVIASRYLDAEKVSEGLSPCAAWAAAWPTGWADWCCGRRSATRSSGFFMIRRELVDRVAPKLASEGFKILFDLIASQPTSLRIVELPYSFPRTRGGRQ